MPANPGPGPQKPKSTSVRLKRPSTGTSPQSNAPRRTPGGSPGNRPMTPASSTPASGSGIAPAVRQMPRSAGSVGGRRVQGVGLAMKMSLAIAVLVFVVMTAFGVILTNIIESSSYDAIKRYGATAALCLGQIGAQEIARYKARDATKPWPVTNLRGLLGTGQDAAASIEDAVIYYGSSNTVVASAQPSPLGLRNKTTERIGSQEFSNVTCERGYYDRAGQGPVPALLFTVQIGIPGDSQMAKATLIVSAESVSKQVNSVIASAVVAGLFCILAGIAVSYILAAGIIRPVRSLMRDMDVVSRGDFDHSTKPTSSDEVGLLALAFNDMTKSLRAARELERESERMQSELNIAREIQAHLLPPKIPQLPGFDTYQCYRAAKEVGGDYFDFIPVDRENLAVVVADVSGKGIPGSMVMAQTRAVLRMLATGNQSASETLAQTNAIVARDIKRGMFVTMLYAVLNVRLKTLRVASAGHNPMALVRARTGQVELVNPSGIALGFDKGPIFNRTIKEQTIQLYKGDRAVLYTDGVVEAMNEKHEEYGDERFYKWLQAHAVERSRDLINNLLKELDAHRGRAEQHDDITVVTIRVD